MSATIKTTQIDHMTKNDLETYQLDRLKDLLSYVSSKSPFYRKLFKKHQINWKEINSLADFTKIPNTEKKDLAEDPTAFLCVPLSQIAEFTTTSGTVSKPVTIYLTRGDIDRLGDNEAKSMLKASCNEKDIFQLATTMDKRFMAGLAYAEGVRKLGGGLVRVGASSPALHWDSIQRFNPTVIIAIPSFILKLIEYAKQHHIDFKASSLKKVIAIGQPIRKRDLSLNAIGQRIEDEWGLDVYSTYASTEMASAFTECEIGRGGHLQADLIYLEVLDENNQAVKNGEQGEIVISTFGIEAMPLLRYRTGDIAIHYQDSCECGRTTSRLGPILGRKNQMIKFKGTTVHPSSLIPLLDAQKLCKTTLIELSTDELGLDCISILFSKDEIDENIAKTIIQELADSIKVKPYFRLLETKRLQELILPPSKRKAVKILDKRS